MKTKSLKRRVSRAKAPVSVQKAEDPAVTLVKLFRSTITGDRLARSVRASIYEAGSSPLRHSGWTAPTLSPNAAALAELFTLRNRSRLAVRNDGYAKGVIDKMVTNIVGTGIRPLSRAEDQDFQKAVQELWELWTAYSDADGRLDWYGQEQQIVRTWLEAGEVFIRIRPRFPQDPLPVALQLQVIEPELCPHNFTMIAGGNVIRAGIEFDQIGRRVAYWFYEQRPGDFDQYMWTTSTHLVRVPAESVIHLYDPLRAGQLRGTPHLTQALVRLRELDKFDDATLLRQQIANMFVAFLKRPSSAEGTFNPLTGTNTTETSDTGQAFLRPALGLEPGLFQELGPGEEVDFSKPPDAGSGYEAYMVQQLRAIAAATGVPYEVFTGDMSKVNDRTVRVILQEFKRYVQSRQHHIVAFQLCRPVWKAWLDRVFISGTLGIPAAYAKDPTPWSRVKWMPQGWPYIHPVQDVIAVKQAIRCGLTSRASAVSEQGEDATVIDMEQARDNDRSDGLDLLYDSDGRQPEHGPKLTEAGSPPPDEPDDPRPGPKPPAPSTPYA